LHYLLYETKANLDRIEEQHTSILEAIKAHDTNAARISMQRHIQFLRDVVREYNEQQ
jgi:DNA-binding GntR family transcriptional regulator